MNAQLLTMRIGKRQQQGRNGEGRTGTHIKEVCPSCKEEYMEVLYKRKEGVFRRWGLY